QQNAVRPDTVQPVSKPASPSTEPTDTSGMNHTKGEAADSILKLKPDYHRDSNTQNTAIPDSSAPPKPETW
ncbi:MAG TPA: hypothetical protein VJ280_05165, partial [Dehalococcoidales bacterium]|nr:hypothetical protein [Dehalococcoidales bacterium]